MNRDGLLFSVDQPVNYTESKKCKKILLNLRKNDMINKARSFFANMNGYLESGGKQDERVCDHSKQHGRSAERVA